MNRVQGETKNKRGVEEETNKQTTVTKLTKQDMEFGCNCSKSVAFKGEPQGLYGKRCLEERLLI